MNDETVSNEPEAAEIVSTQIRRPILRAPDGKILPGSGGLPGSGRPKGSRSSMPTLATLVRGVAEAQGVTVKEAMNGVVEAVIKKALSGDMKAAELLIKRMPEIEPTPDPNAITVELSSGPPIPTDQQGYAAEAAKVIAELTCMKERQEKLRDLLK